MALDLVNYEEKASTSIQAFWGNRAAAQQKQVEAGKADQGERGGVTAGKNMDGFVQEQLYSTATLIVSPRTAAKNGEYLELSAMTELKTFVTSFAGHIAATAARLL